MSTLLRIIVMFLVWLIFTLLTFYTCIKPQCCNEGQAEVEQVIPPVTDDYAIVSSLNSQEVLTGNQWDALRSQILTKYREQPDQVLEVYGNYYPSEPSPPGFDNMGLYRAQQIKDLLTPDIPADRIRTLARRLDPPAPADEDELWQAGSFGWSKLAEENESEYIELDRDQIKVRFPFDSSTKSFDQEIDEYLQKLAERLKQTNETVVITGHTDNIDTDQYNMALGQRRADFLKRSLVKYGAPADQITTRSEGESNPEATNSTAEGRRLNRRAELKLRRAN